MKNRLQSLIRPGIFLLGMYHAVICTVVHAQQFKFNHYTTTNGLEQQYIYDINQSATGYLWIATSEGVLRYDGDAFRLFTEKDGLAENFTTRIFISSVGDIWMGHNQGGISVFSRKNLNKIITSAAEFGTIAGMAELKDGSIIAMGQSGKLFLRRKNIDEVYDLSKEDVFCYAMSVTSDNRVLVGTDAGLMLYRIGKRGPVMGTEIKIASIPEEKIQCITPSKIIRDAYWVATVSGSVYKLTLSTGAEPAAVNYSKTWGADLNGIQNICEDTDGSLWISTFTGVNRFVLNADRQRHMFSNAYNNANGLPGEQVKCAFQDRENNMWLGMYGNGLAMLKDVFFSFYDFRKNTGSSSTHAVLAESNTWWLGTEEGLLKIDLTLPDVKILYNASSGFVNDEVTCLKRYNGFLMVGTAKNGLYCYDDKQEIWKPVKIKANDKLVMSVRDIEPAQNSLWVGTRGGLFELDENLDILRELNTGNGLMHNSINDLLLDTHGKLWVSTQGNMAAVISGKDIRLVEITGPGQSINITCLAQDLNGAIWAGTYGNGVFRQHKGEFEQFTSEEGLSSDYCYFIQAGSSNEVWVGHRGALSRIDARTKQIVVFDKSDGIDSDFNELASCRDKDGYLWFGASKGVVRFDPHKFGTSKVQPVVNIKGLIVSDKEMDFTQPVELGYNNYRLNISFIGIHFTNPEKVRYKYILKGFDLAWSDVSASNQAYYPKISDGEYEFIVKACNEDGVFGKSVARIKITIASPYWKKWWFFVACFLVLAGVVVLIIQQRERNQRKIRLYLENQLQLRTRELVEQKSLVEEKNKDITDSINYAHRIQSVILPSVHDIKSALPESYILYKPRDIVSGDFYWYSVKDHLVSLAVADCTGHGVPGAFMSMIGTTVFKEINNLDNLGGNPAGFIRHVDEHIISMMNPTRRGKFQDGMDMILIEINTRTNEVIFAGAGRPLLQLKPDGTHIMHRTCNDSIGGVSEEKGFANASITVEKGDQLVLFSDGIVDQFGGPNDRKIMTGGFIKWVKACAHLSMDEQAAFLEEAFEKWRGDEPQIDDVCVVTVRF